MRPAAIMHIWGCCCCCWGLPQCWVESLRSCAASARLSANAETAAHWKCHLLPGQSSLRSAASEASTLQCRVGWGVNCGPRMTSDRERRQGKDWGCESNAPLAGLYFYILRTNAKCSYNEMLCRIQDRKAGTNPTSIPREQKNCERETEAAGCRPHHSIKQCDPSIDRMASNNSAVQYHGSCQIVTVLCFSLRLVHCLSRPYSSVARWKFH